MPSPKPVAVKGEQVHDPSLGLELRACIGNQQHLLSSGRLCPELLTPKFCQRKYILFPPSSYSIGEEGLNFKRMNEFLCVVSIPRWTLSQRAHLCGLGVSYRVWRTVLGCWGLIVQCRRVIKFNRCIFLPLLAEGSLGGVCQSYQSVPASRPVVFAFMWP